MKRSLVLRRVAEQEFDDSIAWYEREHEGLGSEFKSAIEACFHRIADHPEHYPKVKYDVRRVVVRRFPFVIHFLIEKKRVVILSVLHTSRNPEQIKYRR